MPSDTNELTFDTFVAKIHNISRCRTLFLLLLVAERCYCSLPTLRAVSL